MTINDVLYIHFYKSGYIYKTFFMISEAGCTHNEQLLQNVFSLGVVPHIENCENYTYFHSNAKGNFEVYTYINVTFDFINILQKLCIYIYIYIYIYVRTF